MIFISSRLAFVNLLVVSQVFSASPPYDVSKMQPGSAGSQAVSAPGAFGQGGGGSGASPDSHGAAATGGSPALGGAPSGSGDSAGAAGGASAAGASGQPDASGASSGSGGAAATGDSSSAAGAASTSGDSAGAGGMTAPGASGQGDASGASSKPGGAAAAGGSSTSGEDSAGGASPAASTGGTSSGTAAGASSTSADSAGAAGSAASESSAGSGGSTGGPYDGRTYQGRATTYDAKWSSGNCLLSRWPQPKGLGPVAIAEGLWDSARMCGACLSITSSFGTHLGIVTDQSDVKGNSIDMGPDVWSQVSNHQKSSALPITWHLVPCNFTTPIEFYNKNGASQYYTAIQVAGSNKPIKSLEASTAGYGSASGGGGGGSSGGWVKLVRASNSNHFGPPSGKGGLGTKADLRVTCDNGKQFITKGVSLVDSSKPTPASGNC